MAQRSIESFFKAPQKRNSHAAVAEIESDEEDVLAVEEPEPQRVCADRKIIAEPVAAAEDVIVQPEEQSSHDIGHVVKLGLSASEISSAVEILSTGQKYGLLFKHTLPPAVLPATRSYGCNHRFNKDWLAKYPWLVYSTAVDGVYCAPCAIMYTPTYRLTRDCL